MYVIVGAGEQVQNPSGEVTRNYGRDARVSWLLVQCCKCGGPHNVRCRSQVRLRRLCSLAETVYFVRCRRLHRDARVGHDESTLSPEPCAGSVVFRSSQDSSVGVSEVESSDVPTSPRKAIKQHHAMPSPTSTQVLTPRPRA
jgi:hypothetical protein